MNELQAMAIAALEASKDEAELARLRAAVKRESKMNTPLIGVLHVEVQVPYYAELLREAEYRHARISAAIEWVKAVPQFDHITTHKAAELRHRGYKDVGVVLQDDLGSTAVVAHGKVTWTEPNLNSLVSINIKQKRFEDMVKEKYPKLSLSMTSRYNYVDPEVASMWIGYKEGLRLCDPLQTTVVDGTTTITSLDKDSAKSVTFMPTQTIKYDAEAAKAIIKGATPCGQVTTAQTGKPIIAYARRWFVDGIKPVKGVSGYKLLPLTKIQCRADDIALVARDEVQPC